jgi:hypothetical protein
VAAPHRGIRVVGILLTIVYAAAILWIYATGPRTLAELATGAQVAAGTYRIDQARFDNALQLFRREQFRAARGEWERADPAQRDARTQFYIAYACYREGWGRFYPDAALFRQGLDAVSRAIALTPQGTLVAEDPQLKMRTAAELKAELEQGLERSVGNFNPLRVLRERK